jgi:N-acetylmuramoyl-L-alanine amidase
VWSSIPSNRLRAQALRGAVEENADDIADRLPQPLRPGRRFLEVWGRRAWVLAFPLGVVTAWAWVGDSKSAGASAAGTGARVTVAAASPVSQHAGEQSGGNAHPTLQLQPDPSLLSRPLGAQALGLGVRRVVLDPGHGGDNLGTASANGLLEKDLTLDLAKRVRELLVTQGVDAVLTRTRDDTLSLKERAAVANGRRGDIFVSIHLNSVRPSSLQVVETYYLGPGDRPEHDQLAAKENEHSGYSLADMRALLDGIYADARRAESKRLAQSVQQSVVRRLRSIDPRIKDRGVKMAPFIVLVATEMPAILAEVACLSNPDEGKRLRTDAYRQTIAEALAAGIVTFGRAAAPRPPAS